MTLVSIFNALTDVKLEVVRLGQEVTSPFTVNYEGGQRSNYFAGRGYVSSIMKIRKGHQHLKWVIRITHTFDPAYEHELV